MKWFMKSFHLVLFRDTILVKCNLSLKCNIKIRNMHLQGRSPTNVNCVAKSWIAAWPNTCVDTWMTDNFPAPCVTRNLCQALSWSITWSFTTPRTTFPATSVDASSATPTFYSGTCWPTATTDHSLVLTVTKVTSASRTWTDTGPFIRRCSLLHVMSVGNSSVRTVTCTDI